MQKQTTHLAYESLKRFAATGHPERHTCGVIFVRIDRDALTALHENSDSLEVVA